MSLFRTFVSLVILFFAAPAPYAQSVGQIAAARNIGRFAKDAGNAFSVPTLPPLDARSTVDANSAPQVLTGGNPGLSLEGGQRQNLFSPVRVGLNRLAGNRALTTGVALATTAMLAGILALAIIMVGAQAPPTPARTPEWGIRQHDPSGIRQTRRTDSFDRENRQPHQDAPQGHSALEVRTAFDRSERLTQRNESFVVRATAVPRTQRFTLAVPRATYFVEQL